MREKAGARHGESVIASANRLIDVRHSCRGAEDRGDQRLRTDADPPDEADVELPADRDVNPRSDAGREEFPTAPEHHQAGTTRRADPPSRAAGERDALTFGDGAVLWPG
jgi:hypothetical protein